MQKIILAGYGGQGMLLCGQVLAFAAMKDGFHSTWLPTYGPEMRGGAAACFVVVSDKTIGSPVVKTADLIAVMSQPAFDRYCNSAVSGGYVLYNSELVTVTEKRADIQYVAVEFSSLAMELGDLKVANMLVLGCLNKLLSCLSMSAIQEGIIDKFSSKGSELVDLNMKAVKMGMEVVDKLS